MDTIDDLFKRLEQLNAIGASLSRERNLDRLLESILIAAKAITRADGGTLYLMTDDGKALRFAILRTDSLELAMGGTTGRKIELPDLPLTNAAGEPNTSLVAACAAIRGTTINIADAYSEMGFDFTGTRIFDERFGDRKAEALAEGRHQQRPRPRHQAAQTRRR